MNETRGSCTHPPTTTLFSSPASQNLMKISEEFLELQILHTPTQGQKLHTGLPGEKDPWEVFLQPHSLPRRPPEIHWSKAAHTVQGPEGVLEKFHPAGMLAEGQAPGIWRSHLWIARPSALLQEVDDGWHYQ